jgi:hypothetical protein
MTLGVYSMHNVEALACFSLPMPRRLPLTRP